MKVRVLFGSVIVTVRFSSGSVVKLWVSLVRFGMALEWGSSSVCSVQVQFDSHL